MPTREIDEILEILWMEREKGKNDLGAVEAAIKAENLPDLTGQMQEDGLVELKGDKIHFTDKGEKAASGLIRRHRLAERLLVDIMEVGKDAVEEPACQFEHLVSEEVTEAICTLLGHPKVCPHGLPIPEGRCCEAAKKMIEALIFPLDHLEVGEWATVAYILAHHQPRLHKLMSFGIAPGVKVKMHQKSPGFVIQVEETQIALEKEIVKDIYVRKR